jgi:soluble lytic murein transglycosylase-like protein
MIIKIPAGNSTTSPRIVYSALFVLTIVALTVYCKPFVYGLNMALKPAPAPEAITKVELVQNVKDPLPKPKPPSKQETVEAALDEAAGILAELAGKKNEINELLRYYRNGINELEKQIVQEMQNKRITSYSRGVRIKRVELGLRTIQRRQVYMRKLKKSNLWVKSGSEELLYIKRKAYFDIQLIDIAGGINLDRHMKQLSAAILKYRPTAEKLAIKLPDADILPLETIWSRIIKPKEKTAQTPVMTASQELLKQTGDSDFAKADLKTFQRRVSSRLSRYRKFIKAAAKKHGFDWHLIVAQIYQESHLNPLAKSSAGARGLMQILPGTARSLGVNDIYNPVENINAGVRYLKTLYDQYKSIEGADRMLMALAAYNAGRGHVEDARRLAIKKNLDPDSWESLKKTLPLLRYRKYYKKSKYGYCRGTEPIIYTKRIMTYYKIIKKQGNEFKEARASLN